MIASLFKSKTNRADAMFPARFGRWALLLLLCGGGMAACASDSEPVAPSESVGSSAPSPLIALTPTEYNNTVRDLLSMPTDGADWPAPPASAKKFIPNQNEKNGLFGGVVFVPPWPWEFPPEIGVDDFDGMADGQVPTAYSVEELERAAIHFAVYALVSPAFFTCSGWAEADESARQACGLESVIRFSQRAWRRPLSDAERARIESAFDAHLKEGTAEEAVVLMVSAVLQSPHFLYRVETAGAAAAEGPQPITGFEMASKLSYFLWDSMPDEALFEAAATGQLSTKAQIQAQAERMLEDPRSRKAVVRFHYQWLGIDKVHVIAPARRAYGPFLGVAADPSLDTTGDGDWPGRLLPIRHSMDAEAHLFIERTVFDGAGSLQALLSDNHGYLSGVTSVIYGDKAEILGGVPSVDWPYGFIVNSGGRTAQLTMQAATFAENERAGLLTMPAVLAVGSYPVHPAPILRGKRLLERVACESFGAPPPGAEEAAPPDAEDASATNRERTEVATSPEACSVCHEQLNPPGFAFENYDSLGVYRTQDNGQAVDATGQFSLSGGETFAFEDGVDLARQLSNSQQVRACYVLRWARYASGVYLKASDPDVMRLQTRFEADDDVKRLLVEITGTKLFRMRRSGGAS